MKLNTLTSILITGTLSLGFVLYSVSLPMKSTVAAPLQEKAVEDTLRLSPTVLVPSERGESVPLLLNECSIDVRFVGSLAETEMTLVYENKSSRQLEGTFYFPLQEGQFITDFQMETSGIFRPASVVTKKEGRVAFEATIRRKIDPALLEWTQGNNFKARVFPIPANGKKTIRIVFAQVLKQENDVMTFDLPLNFKDRMKKFEIKGSFDGNSQLEYNKASSSYPIRIEQSTGGFTFNYVQQDIYANQPLRIELPLKQQQPSSGYELNDSSAVVLSHLCLTNTERPKRLPNELTLLWDVSSSSSSRDFERERAVLTAYLEKLGNAKLHVITFSNAIHSRETIDLTSGYNVGMLFTRLAQLPMDGGTQLGIIQPSDLKGEEVVLLSDCLSNFGKDDLKAAPNQRVIVLTSSSSTDPSRAKAIAASNGEYIPLANFSVGEATQRLQTERIRFLGIEGVPNDQVTGIGSTYTTNFSVCAKTPVSKLEKVTYLFGYGNTVDRKIDIKPSCSFSSDGDLVERLWAARKIEDLDVQPEKNKAEIEQLGLKYSLISRYTSLIVLDRLEDYLEYGILPPKDLQKEYNARINEQKKNEAQEAKDHEAMVLNDFEELKKWYVAKYVPKPKQAENDEDGAGTGRTFGNATAAYSIAADMSVEREEVMEANTYQFNEGADAEKKTENKCKASISLEAWNPETPYMAEIKKAVPLEAYNVYLQQKMTYGNQPSFYVDVSDYFLAQGKKDIALRILSNIAEMELENPQLLRVLGHRLDQMSELSLSIAIFEDVKALREEEPQSYRDLALVLERNGKYTEAAKELLYVIEHKWDERFRDVEAISLVELNHLLINHPEVKGSANIDAKYVYAMPVDTRVILTWDTDNCDIDLWVTDPRGEKCFYSHALTELGGRISKDCVAGYGPEEFMLKLAPKGKYKIQANYYGSSATSITGPTTIQLKLITNYGKPNEKVESITRRLETAKEVIDLGEFIIE